MNAQELAISLSNLFLSEGQFDNTPIHAGGGGMVAAAGTNSEFMQAIAATGAGTTGFAGLSVQAVGYDRAAENGSVYVYVAQGNLKNIPNEIGGVRIHASKMASLRINPQLTGRSTNRGYFFDYQNGRVSCGSSCAPSGEQYSGTFGALVTDGQDLFALSNNHVFAACNHVKAGMPILSPSTQDSHPSLPAPREIGRHAAIVELRSGDPAFVTEAKTDVALAKVIDRNAVTSWQGDGTGYDTPTSIIDPSPGLRVKKIGRTTSLTTGTVEATLVKLPLPYKTNYFSATVYFTDVWTIRADAGSFALPGDSGSLVVTEDGQHAVGLIFAMTSTATHNYAVIVTIRDALELLGQNLGTGTTLELVSRHGVEVEANDT